ncbi:MAG: DNA-directed RNA polymerase subunit alpha, partial [Candidatus Binatia bacterium]
MFHKNWRDLIKPKRLEIDEKSLATNYGKFVAEPFERGFGITIGNSLRRILLSSLQGAGITSVQIKGVLHEFSTIPGVREDVTDIVLNLKEVRVRASEEGPYTARIDAKGEGVVTAGQIIVGPGVEIMNPDQHVATLSKEAHLEKELTIRSGRGYVSAERNKEEGAPVGTIPIDSVFSPVRKVNYAVTNARVGQRTDY